MNANGSAYELNSTLFIEILKLSEDLIKLYEKLNQLKLEFSENIEYGISKIANISSDSSDGIDYLDINRDIIAFAKVIAAKTFKPPLAIALFGKWGMGKSFFMKKLEEKIDFYSQKEINDSPYCQGVVHIHFNAWSYMDANLWASIVSRIFDCLNNYINDLSTSDEEKNKLFELLNNQLETVKFQIEELKEKKADNGLKIKVLESEKEEKEKKLKDKILNIKNNSINKVILGVNKNFEVSRKIKNAIQVGIEPDLMNLLKDQIPESYQNDPTLVINEIKSKRIFFKQLLKRKNIIWFFIILSFSVFVSFSIPFVINYLSPKISSYVAFITQGLFSIILIFAPLIHAIKSTFKKVQPILNVLWSIKVEYDREINQAIINYNEDKVKTEIEIANLEKELEIVSKEIREIDNEITTIEHKIKNNLSTLTFNSFIEKRTKSSDYQELLGIVSIIRRDFEILSHLFLDLDSEVVLDKPLKRIVLYIDDLDRCPEDRVVEVLEAVNLLMAFPLFVVIVGVDPRWVKNALIKKYELQFGDKVNSKYELIDSKDYLEKIFQVPFHLKQAENQDVRNMLYNLTIDSVKDESTEVESNVKIDSLSNPNHNTLMSNDGPKESKSEDVNIVLKKEHLTLSMLEVELMQDLSKIIGNNPRAIKRFVNVYQIVRAHEGLQLKSNPEIKDFLNIMFLLALPLGPYKVLYEDFLYFIDTEKFNLTKFLSLGIRLENYQHTIILQELNTTIHSMKNTNELLSILSNSFKEQNNFVKRFTFSDSY